MTSYIRGTTATSSSSSIMTTTMISQPSFDFYVLAMTYQPDFCDHHASFKYPGCERPLDFWRKSLTIHGLWPQYKDGTWPSECSNEKFNPKTIKDIGQNYFTNYWPDVKQPTELYIDNMMLNNYDPTTTSFEYVFWSHEWEKHGTCTGLSQDDYFQTAIQHFFPSPSFIWDNYGTVVTKKDLLNAYANNNKDADIDVGNVVLVCSSSRNQHNHENKSSMNTTAEQQNNNQNHRHHQDHDSLSEVRICIGKNETDATGSKRIKCPESVMSEQNCGDMIYIPQFYIDGQQKNPKDNDDDHSNRNQMNIQLLQSSDHYQKIHVEEERG